MNTQSLRPTPFGVSLGVRTMALLPRIWRPKPLIISLRTPPEPPRNFQIRTTYLLLPILFNQKSPQSLTCNDPKIEQNPRKYGNFGRQLRHAKSRWLDSLGRGVSSRPGHHKSGSDLRIRTAGQRHSSPKTAKSRFRTTKRSGIKHATPLFATIACRLDSHFSRRAGRKRMNSRLH